MAISPSIFTHGFSEFMIYIDGLNCVGNMVRSIVLRSTLDSTRLFRLEK